MNFDMNQGNLFELQITLHYKTFSEHTSKCESKDIYENMPIAGVYYVNKKRHEAVFVQHTDANADLMSYRIKPVFDGSEQPN